MPTKRIAPWEPFWTGKDWRVDFYIGGKRVRKGLGIRSESRKSFAMRAANALFDKEYLRKLRRSEIEASMLFSTACYSYMAKTGQFRFMEKILDIVGMQARIAELTDARLWSLAVENHEPQRRESLKRSFVTPCKAVINNALGKRRTGETSKTTVKRVLTVDQMLRLVEAAGSEEVVGRWDPGRRTLQKISFLLGSGANPGEMFGVQVSDIDLPNGCVSLTGNAPGARKTQYRPRLVYLPGFFLERLGTFPPEGDAFLAPNGQPYTARKYRGGQFRRAFATIAKAAEIDPAVTPYDLRHAWASYFYAATLNLKALTALGGWRDGEMPLSTYVKFIPPGTAQELLNASIDYGQVLDNLIWENM